MSWLRPETRPAESGSARSRTSTGCSRSEAPCTRCNTAVTGLQMALLTLVCQRPWNCSWTK